MLVVSTKSWFISRYWVCVSRRTKMMRLRIATSTAVWYSVFVSFHLVLSPDFPQNRLRSIKPTLVFYFLVCFRQDALFTATQQERRWSLFSRAIHTRVFALERSLFMSTQPHASPNRIICYKQHHTKQKVSSTFMVFLSCVFFVGRVWCVFFCLVFVRYCIKIKCKMFDFVWVFSYLIRFCILLFIIIILFYSSSIKPHVAWKVCNTAISSSASWMLEALSWDFYKKPEQIKETFE